MTTSAKRGWLSLISPTLIVWFSATAVLAAEATRPKPPSLDQLRRAIAAQKKDRTSAGPARTTAATQRTTPFVPTVNGAKPAPKSSAGVWPTDGPITFSFDNMPYRDIFDLVERMTGLPIMGDRDKIIGTVTYFSERKMTVDEALEELNLILKGKAVLIRLDGHLRIIENFSDALREVNRNFIGAGTFLQAKNVASNEIVRVLFRAVNLPANELVNILADTLPPGEVTLAAWKTTNYIQVVGLAGRARKIVTLAQMFDRDLRLPAPGTMVRVFHPKHVTPLALKKALEGIVPPGGVVGPGDLMKGEAVLDATKRRAAKTVVSDAVTVVADDKAGIVVVRAPASLMSYVEQLAKIVDTPGEPPKFHTIVLKHARANDIVTKVIAPYYRPTKRPHPVAADKLSNTITTWAAGRELAELKGLIAEIDRSAAEGPIPEIKPYRVKAIDVKVLAKTLTSVFPKAPGVSFQADRNAGILYVAAPENQHVKIASVIEQIQTRLGPMAVTKMVALSYGDATQIANAVRQAYGGPKKGAARSKQQVSVNPQSNSIIVSGDGEWVDEAIALIKRLDEQVRAIDEVKTFKLGYATAADVAKMVANLYGGKGSRLKVVTDEWSNALFVSGAGANLTDIEKLIKDVDTPTTVEMEANVEIIELKSASAGDVAAQITAMLGGAPGKGKRADVPNIEAYDAGNYIVVSGQPKQIERVRQLVQQIDQLAEEIPNAFDVMPIRKIKAQRLAQMLDMIVPEIAGVDVYVVTIDAGPGQVDLSEVMALPATVKQGIVIGVDSVNNNLMVRARPKDLAVIDETIDKLTADVEADVDFQTYVLKHASPADVAGSLEALFNEVTTVARPAPKKGRKPAPRRTVKRRIRAVPVDAMNAVIVRARLSDFVTIQGLIGELDRPQAGKIHIFRLKHARADAVANNINNVFKGHTARARTRVRRGAVGRTIAVSATADLAGNSVFVSAGPSDLAEITRIVEVMDRPGEAEFGLHIVQVQSGRADRLAPMIQNLLTRSEQARAAQLGLKPEALAVSAEKDTNIIIVAGSARIFDEVKKLVAELEKIQPAGQRRPWVVPLKNIDPNRAKQLLEQLMPRTRSDASGHDKPTGYDLAAPSRGCGTAGLVQQCPPMSKKTTAGKTSRATRVGAAPAATYRPLPLPATVFHAVAFSAIGNVPIPAKTVLPRGAATQPVTTAPATRAESEKEDAVIRALQELIRSSAKTSAAKTPTTQPQAKTGDQPAPLDDASARDLQKLAGQISGSVEINVLADQGALVIYADEHDFELIAKILNMLDLTTPGLVVKTIKLKNVRAVDLESRLTRLYARRRQPRGLPITFIAEPTSNSIFVSASSELIPEIELLIANIDSTEQIPEIELKIFPLHNAQASQVVKRVETMFQKILVSRGMGRMPVTINADDRTNTIIVTAPKAYLDQIEQIIAVLDSMPSYATVDVEIIRLRHADAGNLAGVLNALLTAKGGGGELFRRLKLVADSEDKEFTLDLEKPIKILPNKASQSLAVLCNPENLAAIKQVIDLYDRVPIADDVTVRVFALKHADAVETQNVLKRLFDQGAGLTEVPGTGRKIGVPENAAGEAVVYRIAFAADSRTNTLIVSGRDSSVALVDVLISKLDHETPAELYPIRMIVLEHADAESIAKLMESMFRERADRAKALGMGKAVERMRVIIRADARTNTLLVSAAPADFDTVRDLALKLDLAPIKGFKPVLITLKNLDVLEAAEIATRVLKGQEDLRRKKQRRGEVEPAPVVIPDPRSNSLILVASAQGLDEATTFIEELDAAPHAPGVLCKLYPLKQAAATAVQTQLTDLFKGQKRKVKAPLPTILADDRTNSLVVYADKSDHATIAEVISKLDQPGDADRRVRIFQVSNGQAEDVQKVIDEIYAKKRAAGVKVKPIAITVDERTNALVVSAADDDMAAVASLIERLDTTAITRKMQVTVLPVKSVDASELAQAIMGVMQPQRGGGGLRESVILEFIERTPEGKMLSRRAIKEQLFIYADKSTNLLIILAPEDTVKLVAALVKYIDDVAPAMMIEFFELKNADAGQIKKTLDELFGTGRSRRQGEARGQITAGDVTATGSKLEKELLSITADTRTNSLIVTGTPTYIDLVGQMVRHLDAKEAKEYKTEVIALKNAEAKNVESVVSAFVKKRIDLWKEVYGRDGIAPERILEQEVNIVADEESRKVILQASPKYFDQVRSIINELDAMPPQVMIQALLVEVTLTDRFEYGFEAVGQDLAFTKVAGDTGIGPNHDVVVGSSLGAEGTGVAGFTFLLRSEDLNLLLRALHTDGRLSILSRPQIMARDNVKGVFSVGQNVPIPVGAITDPSSGAISAQVDRTDVVLELEVTPHINPEDFVHLEVTTKVDSVSPSTVQITDNLFAPVFDTRTTTTEVTIRDGETVIIGGMIRSRKEQRETKVPFFGDLPWIGAAFKSMVDVDEKTELLVIITPRVIKSPEEARRLSEIERDFIDLLPLDVRESDFMGNLKVEPDEPRAAEPGKKAKARQRVRRLFNLPTR